MRKTTLCRIGLVALASRLPGGKGPALGHHDVVARTVGRDLTVLQMSRAARQCEAPDGADAGNGVIVANLWSSYQRLAFAAAHSDTLGSHVSAAIAPILNSERVTRLLAVLRRPLHSDTARRPRTTRGPYGLYAAGTSSSAYPPNATPKQRDPFGRRHRP